MSAAAIATPMSGQPYEDIEYDLIPTDSMDDYMSDEQKWDQLPWEDQM